MKFQAALRAVPTRFKVRLLVGLTCLSVLFGFGMLLLTQVIPHPKGSEVATLNWPAEIAYVFWSSFALFMVSPLPWQWTGDDRPMAPLWRGLLQCGVLVALEAVLLGGAFRDAVPAMRPTSGWLMTFVLQTAQYSFAGQVISAWEQRKARKADALAKAREAQWTLLQSQMSPHALLNALNGLAQLVREDLDAGRQGVQDLAEIYKQLVAHGSRPRVSLALERELVRRFLAVEQLRLGNRLKVHWDWDESLEPLEAPPLLLQPLVENAVKHGVAASAAGGEVGIRLARDGQDVILAVHNTGQMLGSLAGQGIGLSNLSARLKLAYGNRAALRLVPDGAGTLAEIRLLEGAR